jgi:hypothetical protein
MKTRPVEVPEIKKHWCSRSKVGHLFWQPAFLWPKFNGLESNTLWIVGLNLCRNNSLQGVKKFVSSALPHSVVPVHQNESLYSTYNLFRFKSRHRSNSRRHHLRHRHNGFDMHYAEPPRLKIGNLLFVHTNKANIFCERRGRRATF